jgi:hypothetical protein
MLAVAGEQPDAVALAPRQDAKAVVLDFMNPNVAGGRRVCPSGCAAGSNQIVASLSSSNAPSSPQAEPQSPISYCLEGSGELHAPFRRYTDEFWRGTRVKISSSHDLDQQEPGNHAYVILCVVRTRRSSNADKDIMS